MNMIILVYDVIALLMSTIAHARVNGDINDLQLEQIKAKIIKELDNLIPWDSR